MLDTSHDGSFNLHYDPLSIRLAVDRARTEQSVAMRLHGVPGVAQTYSVRWQTVWGQDRRGSPVRLPPRAYMFMKLYGKDTLRLSPLPLLAC